MPCFKVLALPSRQEAKGETRRSIARLYSIHHHIRFQTLHLCLSVCLSPPHTDAHISTILTIMDPSAYITA